MTNYTLTKEFCYSYFSFVESMYSIDRRLLASRLYDIFKSLRKVGCILQVSHMSVKRWIKNPYRKPYIKSDVTKTSIVIDTIRNTIQNESLRTLRSIIKEVFGIYVSKELLRNAIKSLGLSRKKARFFTQPKNLKEKTEKFISLRDEYVKENRHSVSMDETSFGRNSKTAYGYSAKGDPLRIQKKSSCQTHNISSLVVASKSSIHDEAITNVIIITVSKL